MTSTLSKDLSLDFSVKHSSNSFTVCCRKNAPAIHLNEKNSEHYEFQYITKLNIAQNIDKL